MFNSKAGVIVGTVPGVFVTFGLQVLGAAGAYWGGSQVYHLRNDDNNDALGMFWRIVGITGGVLALVRYARIFYDEVPQSNRHDDSFSSGFWHAFKAPHEAIKDEFFEHAKVDDSPTVGEHRPLLSQYDEERGSRVSQQVRFDVGF